MNFNEYEMSGRERYQIDLFLQRLVHYKVGGLKWHEDWFYSPEQENFFEQYERQLNDELDGAYILAQGVCDEESN